MVTENWDDDQDIDWPQGPLFPLSQLTNSSNEDSQQEKQQQQEHLTTSPEEHDDLELLQHPHQLKQEHSNKQQQPPLDDDEPGSSIDSRNGTIKALLNSFSSLSLQSPTKHATDDSASSSTSSTAFGSPSTPRAQPPLAAAHDKTSTLRLSSSLSALLSSSASSGPGRVVHLGSTPQGQAKSVLGDWDEDLDLDHLPKDLLSHRALRPKSSFASHISDDPEDDFLGPPVLQSPRRKVSAPKNASSAKNGELQPGPGDSDFDESDFELPTSLSNVVLNAALQSHSRATSTASNSILSVAPPQPPTSASIARLSAPSPAPSLSPSSFTTDDDADDDEGFFEELVLPPYFLSGPGALTPPSSDGGSSGGGGRVNLQAILKQKLEARGQNLALAGSGSGAADKGSSHLDGFRESNEDEGVEHGLEIEEGVRIGPERMKAQRERTLSSATVRGKRAPTTTGSRNSSGRTISSSSTTTSARTITGTTPSYTASPSPSPSPPKPQRSLSRSGASLGLGKPPQPTFPRPSSAAGAVERSNLRARDGRNAPPPAPSTASRDRISRPRTTSLRSVASAADLLTPVGKRVPPRIDTSWNSSANSGSTVLSPLPATPTASTSSSLSAGPFPTPSRTIRPKKSHGNLTGSMSVPASAPALQRKRSLQNLASPSIFTTPRRHGLRSPNPSTVSSSLPSSPLLQQQQQTPRPATGTRSSFAQPTAASASRVRERVTSGPSPSPVLGKHPTSSTLNGSSTTLSRPSSATGHHNRITQPTLASASKTRTRVPSAPLTLSKPRKQKNYGDGTELDGFDDLPTNKERERAVSGGGATPGAGIVTSLRSRIPSGIPVLRSTAKSATSSSSGAAQAKSPTTTTARRLMKRDLSSVSLSSMDETVVGAKTKAREKGKDALSPTTARKDGTGAGPKPSRTASKRLKADVKGQSSTSSSRPGSRKQKEPKKVPQLISCLGEPVVKTQGDMVWNPAQQRWEGNEAVLRDFDRALSSSTRPALITQLSQGSPARSAFPSFTSSATSTSTTSSTSLAVPALRSNAKVVGSMMFDPVRMSWYSISSEEEELDLNLGGEGDFADDEGGGDDGWERGEHARMLKNRASFVMSEGSRDGDGSDDDGASERRAVWAECLEGERRHREEMRPWTAATSRKGSAMSNRPEQMQDDHEREWLWDIRRLIMDTRSPS
ncbi:hypothetical protein T439DRAFT_322577 [Meredithblackwellia eburnea MCA 4105]